MAKKIATVSTVFAACDQLDAVNERWNREDVRHTIGGGGYVVIDPLIQAWRALKPLREVAPSTPAELLHQVAMSLETHVADLTESTESRLNESQAVFENTVSELSERLTALEAEVTEKTASLERAAKERLDLESELDASRETVSALRADNAKALAEKDGLAGRVTRLESEHREVIKALQHEARALAAENDEERLRVNEEHAAALANQRQEQNHLAEQAENRLLVLLDQERQSAKEATAQLTAQVSEAAANAQAQIEKIIKLEADGRQLMMEMDARRAELREQSTQNAELSAALEMERGRGLLLQREFDDYKKEYKTSSDLEAVRKAVTSLQKQLKK